jgi:hypothetical protein
LNARHFGGRLDRPQQILRSTFDRLAGASVNTNVNGTPCRMLWVEGAAIEKNEAVATDSLLHEMIHYDLAAHAGGDGDQAHGARFVAFADAIGHSLGLLPCRLPGFTEEQIQRVASVWPTVQREAARRSP